MARLAAMQVDGKVLYFNYYSTSAGKNQSVVRNYRVFDPAYNPSTAPSGRHAIESWYDVEFMVKSSGNRHTQPTSQQP